MWANAPPNQDFPSRLTPADPERWAGSLFYTRLDDKTGKTAVDCVKEDMKEVDYVFGPTLTRMVNSAIDARLNELKAKVEAMWDAPGMPGWMEVKDEVEKIAPDE